MGDTLLPLMPCPTLQIMITERMVQQLCLVQPGGLRGCEAGPPPPGERSAVLSGARGGMAGIAILDEEHPPQPPVALSKPPQCVDGVLGIFLGHTRLPSARCGRSSTPAR